MEIVEVELGGILPIYLSNKNQLIIFPEFRLII